MACARSVTREASPRRPECTRLGNERRRRGGSHGVALHSELWAAPDLGEELQVSSSARYICSVMNVGVLA